MTKVKNPLERMSSSYAYQHNVEYIRLSERYICGYKLQRSLLSATTDDTYHTTSDYALCCIDILKLNRERPLQIEFQPFMFVCCHKEKKCNIF